ncbi:hypothetical protein CKO45_31950 [Paracraurococcus ruber]|uniref:Uncharacterized protein n=1 Tax=Paracraurococcus ruber TaxID=77675 RepID=A0ABS1D7A8_9PROT|nr:hypothetical protein [Paracraurococcus ruber]
MPSAIVSIFAPSSLPDALLSLTLLVAMLWLCAVAAVWCRQDQLIFRPDARPLGGVPPALAALRFREARLTTGDGLELDFWAADPLPGMGAVAMCVGNGVTASPAW